MCGFGLVVGLHDSNFKRQRYQIQTWAALLGLTNEKLLCEGRRNLQHLPFIYTGGLVRTCVCVRNHACARACVSGGRGCIVRTVRQNSFFFLQFFSPSKYAASVSIVVIFSPHCVRVCVPVCVHWQRFSQTSHNKDPGSQRSQTLSRWLGAPVQWFFALLIVQEVGDL